MTRLVNNSVSDMTYQVNQYKKTLQEAFYEHYKNIYELMETNNFRGEGANAYKEYLGSVTINYITAFINIAEEVSATLEKMSSNYTSLEPSGQGSIDTDIINDVKKNLSNRNNSFQSLASQIASLNGEASNYISVKNLNTSDIVGKYSEIDGDLCNIDDKLNEIDSDCLIAANGLMDRIDQLAYQLKTISNNYHADSEILADKVKDISTQNWYKAEKGKNLSAMMKEDPFFYSANAKYASEGQWAKGFTSDIYGYAGYKGPGGEYTGSINNGVASGNLNASLMNAYENAQLTDYFKQSAGISIVSLAAAGKMGWSKEYAGAQANGSVALASANASAVLGTDTCNVYAKGNASALSANGYANCYYKPSSGDFELGLGGKASAVEASGSVGTSILSVPYDSQEYAGGKVKVTKTLLGGSITGKVGLSAGADFDISSTKVLDFGEVNVNALHVKLGGCLGLGLDADVTVPVPTFDMPWEN